MIKITIVINYLIISMKGKIVKFKELNFIIKLKVMIQSKYNKQVKIKKNKMYQKKKIKYLKQILKLNIKSKK